MSVDYIEIQMGPYYYSHENNIGRNNLKGKA